MAADILNSKNSGEWVNPRNDNYGVWLKQDSMSRRTSIDLAAESLRSWQRAHFNSNTPGVHLSSNRSG